jgi:hypothetical protein
MFFTSALDGGKWSASQPGNFNSGERAPGTHLIGGWVGPRPSLHVVTKRKTLCSSQESNPSNPACSLVAILIKLSQLNTFHFHTHLQFTVV